MPNYWDSEYTEAHHQASEPETYSPPSLPTFEVFRLRRACRHAQRMTMWIAGAFVLATAFAIIFGTLYSQANGALRTVEATHAEAVRGLLNEIRDLKGAVAGKQRGLAQNDGEFNRLRESLAACDCEERFQ